MRARGKQSLLTVWCLYLLGCGPMKGSGPTGTPEAPAEYEVFNLALEEVTANQELRPLQQLRYHITYRGDLARNLTMRARLTHLASGESTLIPLGLLGTGDQTSISVRSGWKVDHAFLRRPGRFEIQLVASILATKSGSEPWVAEAGPLFFTVNPRIDAVRVTSTSTVVPPLYGTPMTVSIDGADLWDEVQVTVEDLDRHLSLPDVELAVPFSPTQSSSAAGLLVLDRGLERVGVHHLQLNATFGTVTARSEPFSVDVTHTVDSARLFVRDLGGALSIPPTGEARTDQVQSLVLQVRGTQLAGHEVSVNGEAPFVASTDSFELEWAPSPSDFAEGKGTRAYRYVVRAGGMERSDGLTLRRWGFDTCEWWLGGLPVANGAKVAAGSKLSLRASGWGFPETETFLFFKKHAAQFKLWERDGGQRVYDLPDLTVNNDDEVATLTADMRSSQTSAPWTAAFVEEVAFLGLGYAELYFEVRMEDALCKSPEIAVPAP